MATFVPTDPRQSAADRTHTAQHGVDPYPPIGPATAMPPTGTPPIPPLTTDRTPVPARNRSRFAWLGILIGGAVLYWLVLTTMITTGNVIYFPTMLLLGSAVVPATVLTYAVRGGRRPVGSIGLVVLTAVGGGILGTLAAGALEYRLAEVGLLPMVAVAVIEEGAKLVIPVLVMLIIGAHDRRLGVVLGIASGMGFAILETMGYGFAALLASGSIAAADQTLVIRALLSPACHIAWTGIAMAAIWNIQTARQRDLAVVKAMVAAVGVIALHTVWNTATQGSVVQWIVGLVSLGVLLSMLRRAHREDPLARRVDPYPVAGGFDPAAPSPQTYRSVGPAPRNAA